MSSYAYPCACIKICAPMDCSILYETSNETRNRLTNVFITVCRSTSVMPSRKRNCGHVHTCEASDIVWLIFCTHPRNTASNKRVAVLSHMQANDSEYPPSVINLRWCFLCCSSVSTPGYRWAETFGTCAPGSARVSSPASSPDLVIQD